MASEMLAFTADQVSRLTGLSERRLRYWDNTGFFAPHYAEEERGRAYSRLYSFEDVVGLRTIGLLLNEHHIPLHELRKVGAWLAKHHGAPWASLRFYVAGRRVYFDDPETGARVATRPQGQMAFPIEMEEVAASTRHEAERARRRDPALIGQVTRKRNIVRNETVLAGTRIPTESVWNFHEAGYDTDAILREYPHITRDDICAAIAHEERRRQKRAG